MHSIWRIIGIIAVFVVVSIAWEVLGGVTLHRSESQSGKLGGEVGALWGTSQAQDAPSFTFQWTTAKEVTRKVTEGGRERVFTDKVEEHHSKPVTAASSELSALINLDQRLKGLMWYSLFTVSFDGMWTYVHTEPEPGTLDIVFRFPDPGAMYDEFQFAIDGHDLARKLQPQNGDLKSSVFVRPGATVTLRVHYKTRGKDAWSYVPATGGVASLRNFHLGVMTDFTEIDYPASGMSPSFKKPVPGGWKLDFTFNQVLTGHQMGVVMPSRIQPGELASSLAFSGPVSLLLFFLVMFVFSVLRKLDIHPINYLFIAGAFFAFHLLFAYSVDHIHLVPAFVLSSVASIVLVVSYLRLVVSNRFAFVEAALAQLVYQVGFSLAHFWDGYTGLTVSVLATSTLFLLMQLTGRVRWSNVLAPKQKQEAAEPRPA